MIISRKKYEEDIRKAAKETEERIFQMFNTDERFNSLSRRIDEQSTEICRLEREIYEMKYEKKRPIWGMQPSCK